MSELELLSNERKGLLIFGYIRENTLESTEAIPIALIKLCELFHTTIIPWKIQGNKFEEFKTCSADTRIKGPTFTFKNIKFQLVVVPKKSKFGNYHAKYTNFFLEMDTDSLPINLSSFDIHITPTGNIFNDTNKKHTLHFIGKYDEYNGFHFGNDILLSKIKKHYQEIDAGFIVELSNVKNNNMNTYSKFNWKLNQKEMDLITTSSAVIPSKRKKLTVSKAFNNWMIRIRPFGEKSYRSDLTSDFKMLFRIKPISMPYSIKMIKMKCHFIVESDTEIIEFNHHVKCWGVQGVVYKLIKSRFNNSNTLNICVEVCIKEIYDNNCVQLDHTEREKYGFVGPISPNAVYFQET
eukprot:449310_1